MPYTISRANFPAALIELTLIPKLKCMQHKLTVWFVLLPLLLMSISSYSQNKITGTVTNENEIPLVGATIQLKETIATTITDSKGQYILTDNRNFSWTVLISYTGLAICSIDRKLY